MNDEKLKFKVSTGLKNLIGKDLISDKYIAIFELVKNSYDAGATEVTITFDKNKAGGSFVKISDNGHGMNKSDIKNKWLFVAYSEKKLENNTCEVHSTTLNRVMSGAKGVGRFSCDRLGEKVQLVSKTVTDTVANIININWGEFELNDSKQFGEIEVEYSTSSNLLNDRGSGTILTVTDLREEWNRDDYLKLKHSLMKLINPEINTGERDFNILIDVPDEAYADNKKRGKKGYNERDVVNGIVKNDIFEKFDLKTTNIDVTISEDGKFITTRLSDRGEYIFTITEKNVVFDTLRNIHITVYFLNRSAKLNFKRIMGIHAKEYGSIFIYKNGFRVFPYGEPELDIFGINLRKSQGWSRFLGTREIMGRISILGLNDGFIESTSRAHGFINTADSNQLSEFFVEKVLKVLERYVVNIIVWGEALKNDPSHTIQPYEVGDAVKSQFFEGRKSGNIVEIDVNPNILKQGFTIENGGIPSSLKRLQQAADNSKNDEIIGIAKKLSAQANEVLSQNLSLEKDITEKSKIIEKVTEERNVREQQIYFLKYAENQDVDNLLNGMHTIFTLTQALRNDVNYLRDILLRENLIEIHGLLDILADISIAALKADKVAELAIKGNTNLRLSGINSISDYLSQCLESRMFLKGLEYSLVTPDDTQSYLCKFDPVYVGIILDNIAKNAIKARATQLEINISETEKYVLVSFMDNGVGLNPNLDAKLLFESGISTTMNQDGHGMGLSHIRKLVEDMRGTVGIDTEYSDGFKLDMRLKK